MATPNMGLILPTEGGDSGIWDTELNTALTAIDAHDHTSGNGALVPSAGLNINADLSFGGYAATSLKAAEFSEQASFAGLTSTLAVSSSDHELYWMTSAGTQVKLTSGASINTALVGGITGDYAMTNAEWYYADSGKEYRAYSDVTTQAMAWLATGTIELFYHGKIYGTDHYIRIYPTPTIISTYDIVLPGSLSGISTVPGIWTIDNGGSVAFNPSPTVTTLTSNGLITSVGLNAGSGTIQTTGSADFSGASGIHFPSRDKCLDVAIGQQSAGTATYDGSKVTFAAVTQWDVPIPLDAGDRITAITIYFNRNSGSPITFELWQRSSTGGGNTSLCQNSDNTTTGAGSIEIGTTPVTGSLPQTLATPYCYMLRISANNTDSLSTIIVTYDRP